MAVQIVQYVLTPKLDSRRNIVPTILNIVGTIYWRESILFPTYETFSIESLIRQRKNPLPFGILFPFPVYFPQFSGKSNSGPMWRFFVVCRDPSPLRRPRQFVPGKKSKEVMNENYLSITRTSTSPVPEVIVFHRLYDQEIDINSVRGTFFPLLFWQHVPTVQYLLSSVDNEYQILCKVVQ